MDNIIRFPVIPRPQRGPASPLPTFLHCWASFIAVIEAEEDEALPIRGRAADEGPQFEFDGHYVLSADVEEWSLAILWMSPSLMQIVGAVLAEALAAEDGIGRFNSDRWDAFRKEVVRATGMEWDRKPGDKGVRSTILEAARRDGIDFEAEHIVDSLLVQSRMADRLRSETA
ncbi:hypothetical protein [Mesorhizobium sp. B2-4-6]|uniref:hypothetical protein n=1 Tax=Mesorhizobium sp. B2-4-6 TaxID=2589943 RepID=UPI00112708A5|nr:hypothetical protein [Mesorhizobium sp. B2-4-6]TPL45335.1 hypothetical protein FJ957_20715 [Mesorhizobium sp. B2-4-6]